MNSRLLDMPCAVCGTNKNLDRHHVLARGMGGSKAPLVHSEGNLITLCRGCHRNIHEGGWELQRSPRALRVVDRRTGEEVMRRLRAPNFDPSSFFQLLNALDTSLSEALNIVPYLEDDQLVEAFRCSRSLGKRSWLIQSAILHEAQRRSVYGDRGLEAIARRFEISLRQAQKYALVWRLFFREDRTGEDGDDTGDGKNVNVDAFFLDEPSWYIVAATESPEPQRWLAYAQDRKAERPSYSISDFRHEIQQAVRAAGLAAEQVLSVGGYPTGRLPWECPWVKAYCTRSGRPVPVDDCPCEDSDFCETKPSSLGQTRGVE